MDSFDLLEQYHSGLTRRADTAPFWLTPGEYWGLVITSQESGLTRYGQATTRYIAKLMSALDSIEKFSQLLFSTTTEKPEMEV